MLKKSILTASLLISAMTAAHAVTVVGDATLSDTAVVHPGTVTPTAYLTFLFREAGFDEVDIDWRSPPAVEEVLEPVPGDDPVAAAVNANVSRLNRLLFGPQDYALIAVR